MPAMIVWPVSSSVKTLNVGSSSASRWIATPSFSWSPLVFGSMATEMTGAGKVIDSSTIGASAPDSVSPVVVCLSPITAQMSPARTSLMSSREFACICMRRPIFSLRSLVLFRTCVPAVSVPE